MKELLISITTNENQEPVVSGRELHRFLEVGTPYSKWFDRMAEYGFTEKIDFQTFLSESTGGRPSTDHAIKIDMAKELSMLQRNERGKQARQYFIQVERDWNTPDKIMARALKLADSMIGQLTISNQEKDKQIEDMQPKAILGESIASTSDLILVGELAKIIKQNGIDIGERRLYSYLRENGYLVKGTLRSDYNLPTQKSMNLELFRIIENTLTNGEKIRIYKTAKLTGKGQKYFVNKFLKEQGILV